MKQFFLQTIFPKIKNQMELFEISMLQREEERNFNLLLADDVLILPRQPYPEADIKDESQRDNRNSNSCLNSWLVSRCLTQQSSARLTVKVVEDALFKTKKYYGQLCRKLLRIIHLYEILNNHFIGIQIDMV